MSPAGDEWGFGVVHMETKLCKVPDVCKQLRWPTLPRLTTCICRACHVPKQHSKQVTSHSRALNFSYFDAFALIYLHSMDRQKDNADHLLNCFQRNTWYLPNPSIRLVNICLRTFAWTILDLHSLEAAATPGVAWGSTAAQEHDPAGQMHVDCENTSEKNLSVHIPKMQKILVLEEILENSGIDSCERPSVAFRLHAVMQIQGYLSPSTIDNSR